MRGTPVFAVRVVSDAEERGVPFDFERAWIAWGDSSSGGCLLRRPSALGWCKI